MHFLWVLKAALAGVQQGSLLFDFQSPRGSLVAGEGVIQMADGARTPVQGISEGRREPVSLSPSKPASDFPGSGGFYKVFPKEREADGSEGHSPRRSHSSKA